MFDCKLPIPDALLRPMFPEAILSTLPVRVAELLTDATVPLFSVVWLTLPVWFVVSANAGAPNVAIMAAVAHAATNLRLIIVFPVR